MLLNGEQLVLKISSCLEYRVNEVKDSILFLIIDQSESKENGSHAILISFLPHWCFKQHEFACVCECIFSKVTKHFFLFFYFNPFNN